MPYALKEKQREFQRRWSNAKNAKKPLSLSRSIITWEELQCLDNADRFALWPECINGAKEILTMRQVNRIAIATLCLKACSIRHGGDYRSRSFQLGDFGMTMKSFASEVGVHYKTLNDWVRVTQQIVFRLPKDTKQIDYHAAKMALDAKKSDTEVMDHYLQLASDDGAYRPRYYFMRAIRTALFEINNHGSQVKRILKKDDLQFLIQLRNELKQFLE